ncbi:MAG: gliding motility-associated C-terminal domain-containing protein [Dysgonamonadaceae bacterium]|jgi:gliding motility-associated-like protein|nr:gliding motility-associated C-terminal domain-containing protein [Dysgonamonadaceae bacterium]
MKQHILLAFLFFSFSSGFAQYSVRGGLGTPYKETPVSKMEIYLLHGMQGAQISYTSSGQEKHQWFRYKIKANESVPVESVQVGNVSTVTNIEEGYGYYVGSNLSPATSYVWIIDYSKYLPVFHSININEGNDKCRKIIINASVDAADLGYYTPTGVYDKLPRKYKLTYATLKWEEESLIFISQYEDVSYNNPSIMEIQSPLQDTDFTLNGDQYAEHFGVGKTISTPVYQAVKVEAHRSYIREKNKAPNEFSGEASDLGGSGPIHITFTGHANEPVAGMYIWKISFTPEGSTVSQSIARYTDKTISYNFDREGVYKVQLEVIDRQSVCNDTNVVDPVTIGKTQIIVPQAFSPGSSPGVNDEFRISYTSVVNFKCTIFNRWGTKLYEWNDPARGWDGRVNGRFVPTGVYFYIIQYKGTDGKNKTKKGSVNVLRAKY